MTRTILGEADVAVLLGELHDEVERLVAAAAVVDDVADRLHTTTTTASLPGPDASGPVASPAGGISADRVPSPLRRHRSSERSPPDEGIDREMRRAGVLRRGAFARRGIS
jgi:hypothetical protein